MNVLIIGDVFGNLGKKAIKNNLAQIKQQYEIDLTIANCENLTNCRGLSYSDYLFIINQGVDLITMGNHTWKQNDYSFVLEQAKIIRPINISQNCIESQIGVGYEILTVNNKKVRVINAISRSIIVRNIDFTNPYLEVLSILDNNEVVDINIIDFHADTTSEKNAALKIFSSKATVVVGTHSHVQTNDAHIENNCAYISDIGMSGPAEGIIGAEPTSLINMFLDNSTRFKLTEAKGKYQFCAVVIKIDDRTNIPFSIEPLFIREK